MHLARSRFSGSKFWGEAIVKLQEFSLFKNWNWLSHVSLLSGEFSFYFSQPSAGLPLYQLGCDFASLILLWSHGEYESLLPPYGRGVGGLCIIDEALYRQTELNTEMHTAHRDASQASGGWVGGECGGGSKAQRAPLLTFCICRKKAAHVKQVMKHRQDQMRNDDAAESRAVIRNVDT